MLVNILITACLILILKLAVTTRKRIDRLEEKVNKIGGTWHDVD